MVLSKSEQATLNCDQARDLRAAGMSYRDIGRALALTPGQVRHIRRLLSRAKAANTRLRARPDATDGDLPIMQTILPAGLRQCLKASGYRTLGDLARAYDDPDFAGLEMLPGIGAHRARLVRKLLDDFGLLAGRDDLRAAVESLFPELRDTGTEGDDLAPSG